MCGTKVCSTQRALMTSSPFRPKQREYCAKSRVCISRPFSFPPVFIFPRSRPPSSFCAIICRLHFFASAVERNNGKRAGSFGDHHAALLAINHDLRFNKDEVLSRAQDFRATNQLGTRSRTQERHFVLDG